MGIGIFPNNWRDTSQILKKYDICKYFINDNYCSISILLNKIRLYISYPVNKITTELNERNLIIGMFIDKLILNLSIME